MLQLAYCAAASVSAGQQPDDSACIGQHAGGSTQHGFSQSAGQGLPHSLAWPSSAQHGCVRPAGHVSALKAVFAIGHVPAAVWAFAFGQLVFTAGVAFDEKLASRTVAANNATAILPTITRFFLPLRLIDALQKNKPSSLIPHLHHPNSHVTSFIIPSLRLRCSQKKYQLSSIKSLFSPSLGQAL